jgi:hypothetical protein
LLLLLQFVQDEAFGDQHILRLTQAILIMLLQFRRIVLMQWSKKIIAAGCKKFSENTTPGESLRESLNFLDPDGHKLEIHVGSAETKINVKKVNVGSWKNVG